MIFLFPQGRFGNQIFQYMFAKYIAKGDEKIVTTDAKYFDIIDEKTGKFRIIHTGKLFRYLNFGLNEIFLIFAKCRIITHIKQKHIVREGFSIQTKGYSISKGLFRNIKYVDGFFVNEDDHIIGKRMKILPEYIKKAQKILSQIPKDHHKVFVHIRRGDYLKRSVLGEKDVSLPLQYYKNQIGFFQKKYKNIYFVFLSDDAEYVKHEFNYLKNKMVSENDIGTDFAIMTLCDGAIISASTISYLGAYFMRNKIGIFAPKYFLGFIKKTWYPDGIETKKIDYININH